MIKIHISSREKDLINQIFKDNNYFDFSDNYIVVKKTNINEIAELIGDYFVKYGLDRKLNPTPLGVEIEKLQDKFLSYVD
ncbi:MAG: hypothetical protein K2N23_04405 [Clostridia bacterium]|nr:hypothetical protein [Clostridia bacterium]